MLCPTKTAYIHQIFSTYVHSKTKEHYYYLGSLL